MSSKGKVDLGLVIIILCTSVWWTTAIGPPLGANRSLRFSNQPILVEQVQKLGFAEVSDLGADEIDARYFTNRTDGLRWRAPSHFMRARV
jgi:hypothetical protein